MKVVQVNVHTHTLRLTVSSNWKVLRGGHKPLSYTPFASLGWNEPWTKASGTPLIFICSTVTFILTFGYLTCQRVTFSHANKLVSVMSRVEQRLPVRAWVRSVVQGECVRLRSRVGGRVAVSGWPRELSLQTMPFNLRRWCYGHSLDCLKPSSLICRWNK